MTVEAVLAILRAIVDRLEDLRIERDALRSILLRAGYQPDDIDHIWDDAKADPANRKLARQAYADLREKLGEAGKSSAFEMLLKDTPTPDKPN